MKLMRRLILFAIILAFLIISRFPLRTHYLYSWDSVQYALATENFDVFNHQPHPPGYPIFVAGVKAVDVFVRDANLSMILLNTLLGAVTVFLLFLLAEEIFGFPVACIASFCLAVSNIFWYYGLVANAYIAEAFASTAIAYACWLSLSRKKMVFAVLSVLALALAGGLRPFVMVILFPLWLFANAHCFRKPWRMILLLSLLGVLVLAWLLPTIHAAGGYERYTQASQFLYKATLSITSVYSGRPLHNIARNVGKLLKYLSYSLNIFWLLVLYFAFRAVNGLAPGKIRSKGAGDFWLIRPDAQFMLLWIATPMIFYASTHLPKEGYMLTVIPGVMVLLAKGITGFSVRLRDRFSLASERRILLVLAGIFAFTNMYPLFWAGADSDLSQLRKLETKLDNLFAYINNTFNPDDTLICLFRGAHGKLRHFMYYLPEFTILEICMPVQSYVVAHNHEYVGEEYGVYANKIASHVMHGPAINIDAGDTYVDTGVRRIAWENSLRIYLADKEISIPVEGIRTLVIIDTIGLDKLDEVNVEFAENVTIREQLIDPHRLRICTLQ